MEKKAIRSIKRKSLALATLLILCLMAEIETRPAQTFPAVLSGRIIALDPGHGGYDGGAKSITGRWEKEYNLEIALLIKEELEALGAQVVMTREGDYALCDDDPPIRKKLQDMQRRAALVLGARADVLLSIHMNEYRNARESGPQVFYREDCQAGNVLAHLLQDELVSHLSPSTVRQASAGDYYIVSVGIPAALVECGFISNSAEAVLLGREEYGKKIAQAVADALCQWFWMENQPQAAPAKAAGVA